MMFEIRKTDAKSRARVGRITTGHGAIETPAYVVVGTNAAVRALKPEDIPHTGTQAIIANTFHLWQELGDEGLESYSGLHADMRWQGPIMTDSGGFQVFSFGARREHGVGKVGDHLLTLGNRRRASSSGRSAPASPQHHSCKGREQCKMCKKQINFNQPFGIISKNGAGSASFPKTKWGAPSENALNAGAGAPFVRVTDAGVYFTNLAGEEEYLDAETSVKIQEQLGADIIFAFDEPSSPLHDHAYTKIAMERTHAWATRSLEAKESKQQMYGVVQGGVFEDLRKESARVIGGMAFDGIAIGGAFGNSYGDTQENMFRELGWVVPLLPTGKPRHLLGIGKVADVFAGVEAGIDTFDCVIPTREARHGRIWTARAYYDVLKGSNAERSEPLEEGCACFTCTDRNLSRQELWALFKNKNPEAGRLATIHNLYFFNDLMEKIREAIDAERFSELKREYMKSIKNK